MQFEGIPQRICRSHCIYGALARVDRKLDLIIESVQEKGVEADEEFQLLDLDAEEGKV